MMKVLLLFTLALHVHSTPTPDMKIIIHLHEGPALGTEAGPGGGDYEMKPGTGPGVGAHSGTDWIANGCACINPFIGNPDDHQFPEHYGDPDDVCKFKRRCWVDCKTCKTEEWNKPYPKGKERCAHSYACESHVFKKDVKCTANGRKCWRRNKKTGKLEEIIEK